MTPAPTWVPPGPALLFCPADRPERYGKAADRADVVILDLEDAVAPADRPAARDALRASALDPERTIVRVNPVGTEDHAADLEAVAGTAYRCVMLAKSESAAQVTDVHTATGAAVLALVETPLGVVRAEEIASAPGCTGMMWGAEDLLAAMGGSTSRFSTAEAGGPRVAGEYRDVPRHARARVALAAAAFGRWAVDSVHLDIADEAGQRAEALDAVALGFVGTACIHPSQVAVVRQAYAPDDDEVAWARKVLAAAEHNQGVFQLDGRMVDGPVFRQAEATMRRAAAATEVTTPRA
ncbi:CoA ester lyase [Dietzia cinnamea]|uniref:HpcH/HpaI aldolase/citrate lyase family protein n=1 Tax=Dietzia cinnamea TaxID=321318 RepID=UPI0007BC1512|nr:CoA ester lyase [Dietzia cinnamea]KZO60056.1 citrate lyase subunit beta [Dietzia maris]MCT2059102.1 CoA ester lyase [Dietzia cinnamea]MCT2099638.1 CoA ester lyase [Dietzia cinnamea]MCT2121774.1 CoA ester lyase [Dietzia cinnamea]MCT2145820.1 CoA ester lyase [Dietzia cinnamea]